ncbi:Charged multivesicular body protein 5 [Sparganum proliferum]
MRIDSSAAIKLTALAPAMLNEASYIDNRIATLDKKIDMMRQEIGKYQQQMKNMREGPAKESIKRKAIGVLRQVKQLEKQRECLSSQSFNMDQAGYAIQSVKDTQVTVNAMKTGLKEFKKETKKLDINKIEDLQDDLTDMMELHDEFGEVLGRSVIPLDYNEEDLDAELAALGEDYDASRDSAYLDEALNAPGVPSAAVGGQSVVPSAPAATTSGGVALDEFGLPQIPQQ